MNFMKGSLFHRSTEPEEVEIIEESGGGVLAVWGSPGCGKTVTAVKIAKHLASQKKNVALLLCDMTAPMMPCICPPSELECDKSLGSIFAAQRISVNLIKHNLTTVRNLSVSRKEANRILDDFQPDLVVGTGGYASYPVVHEAAKRGIPTAVHDSNAVPGLTTKRLAKVADRVMVGYEASRAHYQHPERVVVTGTPVRGDFFKLDRQQARAALGITDDRPLVLSYWGSLGAEGMNQHMTEYLRLAAADGAPFHHIHGAGRDFATMTKALDGEALPKDLEIREYIYDMPTVMQAADLVLCRGGASTLSELTAIGKPAVIVPSPYVTNNHQEKNARVLADRGAAQIIHEADCTGQALFREAQVLLNDPARCRAMRRALLNLAVVDSAERIYGAILELAKQN